MAATILLLLERALMDGLGSPVTLVRALGDLGQSWSDPVESVLAAMALAVEALVGYVLVVLMLGSLSALPGSTGRLAARLASLLTPVVARRLLDLLVGGALLTQAALAAAPGVPPGPRWGASHLTSIVSSPFSGSLGPATASDPTPTSLGTGWLRWPVDTTEPAGARPNPRRSAAPLPPWLGGGPSNAAPGLREETGDTAVPGHREQAGATTAPGYREDTGDATGPGRGDRVGDSTTPERRDGRAGTQGPGQRDDSTSTEAPGHHDEKGGGRAPGRRHERGATGASGRRDGRRGTGAPGNGDEPDGTTVARHVVEVGDTLWDIAAARLVPAERSAANIDRYWRQIYRANRSAIGADPDLLHPGTRLQVPPFRPIR